MTGQYEMLLEQNADVPVRDGAILHANVYRPNANGRFPVLMTFGPYGKDVPLREFMQEAWDRLNKTYPEILGASSCKHLVFERPDPEMWVPDGYVVINVDSRGPGKSPGRLDPNSPAEFRDFYDAIEWAGSSLGAAEKSGCSVFPITPRGNGLWPRCGRRILWQFCPGRAHTIFIATVHGRTASTPADFSNAGGTAASYATNTAIRIPTVGTSTPANV